jgi:molybdopterin/thiamine biosynthesis adenylyltransferase/molybdopterin synthase catalytic subunit/rhodanese-related sulfurtransferase
MIPHPMSRFQFSHTAIDPTALARGLADPACGGYASFEGWVRDLNEGRAVRRLEYEAFEELAVREGERIVAEACARFGVRNARCVHRIGDLPLGEIAVWVGVSAPHRDEAFRACRYIIDEVKHRVPIWKKEHYVDGDSGWVNCERCATTPQHAHHDHAHHDHAHHEHAHHEHAHHEHVHHERVHHEHAHHHGPVAPDYSRQTALREVGTEGQARLRAGRVAVVGAGGLGVPVLQYLAGAGVGHLTVIDGDRLEASNLHRQTWYALADCGQPKAALAASRIKALNPEVQVITHTERLDAANGARLLAGHDLLVDCSDNFATKFLLNDLAHELGTRVLFASVHQFEGQLQSVDPARGGACLRCLWPEATRDGVVGNCAEAGVLGPVPGVLGSLQALEAIKILLDMPGRLGDELLLVGLSDLGISRLAARRADECRGRACARSQDALTVTRRRSMASLELDLDGLEQAVAAGYAVIDIRDPAESAVDPLPAFARRIPMSELLAGSNLPADGRYLLVCARGLRSRSTCEALRERGIRDAWSLRGGAQGLAPRT